jgi:anhydro-N-acetylmuramic acid kinase
MVKVIGMMSGTSLDGLDMCYAQFELKEQKWHYKVIKAEDEPYPPELKRQLATAQNMNAYEYALLNSDYGLYLGRRVRHFIDKYDLEPDYIASHGHTIFHQPDKRLTAQIGSGAGIAAESGVDTICDFRTTDVALYGQGAPLVPVGDRNLFADYNYCLNLGGFSNISYDASDGSGTRIAYDISPVNYVLNHYTRKVGYDFDKDGEIARSGRVNDKLLESLNNLEFYTKKGPKSLGREWVEETVIPLIDSYGLSLEDKLATFCEHVALQISSHVEKGRVLITGGGALNKYLVERMRANSEQCTYHVPDALTVNFKEALIFAFLGALFVHDLPGCLKSVTGARYDNIGGALYKSGLK